MRTCAFCGKKATTKDHIPPRSMYPHTKRNGILSVPSCEKCNSGSSDDDEYFKENLIVIGRKYKIEDIELVEKIVFDQLLKKKFKFEELNSKIHVEMTFPSSLIYTPPIEPVYYFRPDVKRLSFITHKYIKGLYVHTFRKKHVPYNCHVNSNMITPGIYCDGNSKKIINCFMDNIRIISDVFAYSCIIPVDRPTATFWLLCFYRSIFFLGSLTEIETINLKESNDELL